MTTIAQQLTDLRARQGGAKADAIASRRQFLISVAGIDGLFATHAGGEPASTITKAWDGGSLAPQALTAPAIPEDLTVTRPFHPVRDSPIVAGLRSKVGRWRTSISVTPTDGDLVPVARPSVYSGILMRINAPQADASSNEAAHFELIFSIERAV